MEKAFKATDLAPEERVAVERLVGRPLQNDEAVELVVHKLDPSHTSKEAMNRRYAVDRIRELAMDKTLRGATVRELIDEGRRF